MQRGRKEGTPGLPQRVAAAKLLAGPAPELPCVGRRRGRERARRELNLRSLRGLPLRPASPRQA
jgi:hypothetical protein